jgi:sulfocyanin
MLARAAVALAAVSLIGARSAPVTVNKFMSYDPATKTVNIKLTAALTSKQGGFNFNGGANGDQTISVPAGWQINFDVFNVDAIPHSALIVADPLPNPMPDNPIIGGAYTSQLAAQNGHDTMNFKAATPGKYIIACGIPGHAASGMWIRFAITPTGNPTYTGL